MKLVQRFYVPERGRVLVDGVDLALADPAWLRLRIGVVLQEKVLFDRVARDDIAFSDPVRRTAHDLAAQHLDAARYAAPSAEAEAEKHRAALAILDAEIRQREAEARTIEAITAAHPPPRDTAKPSGAGPRQQPRPRRNRGAPDPP